MEQWNGHFEMVPTAAILIDHRYQRQEKPTLVSRIAAHPDWAAFGALVCYKRGNMYFCVDGQHRLAGVRASANPPKQVPVISFPQVQLEREAATFVQVNVDRKSVEVLEKHNALVQAKDPVALAVEATVEKAGFSIGASSQSRTIHAVATLYFVYNSLGEEGLLQVLVLAREAWPNDQLATGTNMLRGLAAIYSEQQANGAYNRQKMTTALSKTSPTLLLRKAEEFRFDMGGSKQKNLRRAFKDLVKI